MALKKFKPEESFNFNEFVRLLVSNVVSDWSQASREKILVAEFWNIIRFRLAQFWGTYRGFSITGALTGNLKKTFYYPRPSESGEGSSRSGVVPIDYGVSNGSSEDS
jgi:hypothetical protein